MRKRPRASVTDSCNERLEYFRSKYEVGGLSIRDEVKDAQATFSDKSTDFDSVAKLLNSSDEDARSDVATMLLEISKHHFRYFRHTTFMLSRGAFCALPAPLTVDRETSVRITNVLQELKSEKGIPELFQVITLQKIISDTKCVELAIPRLNSSISDIQLMAVKTIHRCCKETDDEVVTTVVNLLNRSKSESVQMAIIDMLKSFSIDLASSHLSELITFVRNETNDASRVAATRLIGTFGVDSHDAIPALVAIAIGMRSRVADTAMQSIILIDPDGEIISDSVSDEDCAQLSDKLKRIKTDGTKLRHLLNARLKILSSKTSGSSRKKAIITEDEKVLIGNDATLLESMLNIAATSDSVATMDEILKESKLTISGKRSLERLRRYDYVKSCRKGFYLTESGIERAKKLGTER